LQLTDTHGVATFDTLFPGHYSGRATHIHGTQLQDLFTYLVLLRY
jgi:protocatechuate 3,4-dioxygenase beta subunit